MRSTIHQAHERFCRKCRIDFVALIPWAECETPPVALDEHQSREVKVSDFIELKQKQAAVALAETLDYAQAAKRLGIGVLELKSQIKVLEAQLCLFIFREESGHLRLTEDGQYLIQAVRDALSHHEER
jgi:hypothetical protein